MVFLVAMEDGVEKVDKQTIDQKINQIRKNIKEMTKNLIQVAIDNVEKLKTFSNNSESLEKATQKRTDKFYKEILYDFESTVDKDIIVDTQISEFEIWAYFFDSEVDEFVRARLSENFRIKNPTFPQRNDIQAFCWYHGSEGVSEHASEHASEHYCLSVGINKEANQERFLEKESFLCVFIIYRTKKIFSFRRLFFI